MMLRSRSDLKIIGRIGFAIRWSDTALQNVNGNWSRPLELTWDRELFPGSVFPLLLRTISQHIQTII